MTKRAVHFNGATSLSNTQLYKLIDWTTPRECGLISYWYHTFINALGTVLLAHTAQTGFHVLRVSHEQLEGGGDLTMFPVLELGRAVGNPGDYINFFAARASLPVEDGRWHNVVWTWKVTQPIMAACCIDGREVGLVTRTPIAPFTGFSIDFDQADEWRIGGEVTPDAPNYYDGDLAELFMQIEDDYQEPLVSQMNSQIVTPGGTIILFGRGFRTDDGFATELGPDGSGALAIGNNKPQIFCSGDASPPPIPGFRNNVLGRDPRKFGTSSGVLSTAFDDPFPP